MKRLSFILLLVVTCQLSLVNPASAQIKFGYIHYDEVLRQMPEYAEAQKSLASLKGQYDQEATRGEEEFQRKFSDFLQGQKDFPENILVKRQAELQTLMETGIKFRQEARQLLRKAERDLMAGVKERLNNAISVVGLESGYAYVINLDGDACPFINPALGTDVSQPVMKLLGIEIASPEPVAEPVAEPES